MEVEDRFWSKVQVGQPGECWPWLAGVYRNGYGKFRLVTGQLEMLKTCHQGAHRVAFRLATGSWAEVTRHACDNPPCCNPAHLFDGTQADNLEDMTRRGRRSTGVAQATRGVPLTVTQAQAIREAYAGIRGSRTKLALEYGVGITTITRVLEGSHHAVRDLCR